MRDVEQGRVAQPRVSTLRRLADALDLSRIELEELIREAQTEDAAEGGLRIEVLGPLRVVRDEQVIDVGSETQRVLLGLLALSPNAAVSRDALIEAAWGTGPEHATVDLLQSRVSRLRRRLHPDNPSTETSRLLVAESGGYRLNVAEGQHDLLAFRRLVELARQSHAAGRQAETFGLLADAVAAWRGDPLEGLGALQTHPVIIAVQHEYRAAVLEYASIAAVLGRYQESLPYLQRVSESDPVDEAVHSALMIALAGSGQQAAALNIFDTLRRRLAEELGADPGPELSAAHQRVLRQEVVRPEFAPVSAHRQLPPDAGDFSGRAAEAATLHEWLRPIDGATAGRIALIEGMGGVGKTRLAVHVAHQLLAADRFSECQLYVDLRGHAEQPPADPAAVLASFLSLLGVPDHQVPRGVEERASLFRDRLYGKRALVLLDNAAGEDQVLPLMPAGPDNVVLITSRRALALDGARVLPLDVFTLVEAESFLAEVVGERRVAEEAPAARRVVELCGQLPLAVALAARRLQTRPAWTIADIAIRLEGKRGRLRELVAGNRRLHAVFDLSYHALEPEEQQMFRLLGIHPGDEFTADSAAALAGLPPASARSLLDRLVDEHLVTVVTRDRYRIHDLLAEYAADIVRKELPQQAQNAGLGRVLDFYLHTSVRATALLGPQPQLTELAGSVPEHMPRLSSRVEAKRWLDAERACLVAAVSLAADRGWSAHAWQLTRSLREYLGQYGYSHDQDWAHMHEAALAAAVTTGDVVGEALSRTDLAAVYMYQGRSREAREQLNRALAFHGASGEQLLETNVLCSLGFVCCRLGEFREGLTYFGKAISLCTGRDPYRESVALINTGNALSVLGQLDDALQKYRHGLELSRRAGIPEAQSCVLAHMGDAHRRLGRHAEALEHLEGALVVATENEVAPKVACVRHYLGNVYRELGRFDEAMINLAEALRIMRTETPSDCESEAGVLIDFGVAHRSIGDVAIAHDLLEEGLRMTLARGERYQEARALAELAELHENAARAELAEGYRRQAHELFEALGTPEAGHLRRSLPHLAM